MTNQNNAAQAATANPLSDEYVNAVIQQHGYDSPECVIARLHQWIGLHGGENGLTLLMYEAHKALVKLRTPVADEPPGGTRWPVLRAMARNYTAGKHTWDALDAEACAKGAEEIKQLRAAISALASAPAHGDAIDISRERVDETANDRHEATAPVAGEAPPVAEVVSRYGDPEAFGERDLKVLVDLNSYPYGAKFYAAPQASEAVRIQFPAHLRKMWSGGEVQAWLDEHQGVTPPKVSAKGSLERYRKWQAEREEAFGAGVKAAADLVKKMVDDYDTDHGSTDPETGTREYPGDGAAWVCDMEELEGSIRALSAKPAQKEQSDAE